jgi:hypothetical protein
MGCDIHCYVEVKTAGTWEKVGEVFKDRWYDPKKPPDDWNKEFTDQPYNDRNYDLFAILANVRNGEGFAGCDTGDGFVPISKPRDLPENVSRDILDISSEWGCDGHSHSYLTLKELIDFDWSQKTKKRGWVDSQGFREWREKGKPSTWSGGVSGGRVQHITLADMFIKTTLGESAEHCYCQVGWEVVYKDAVDTFLSKTIPTLKKLGDPDNVRIVFWFDN